MKQNYIKKNYIPNLDDLPLYMTVEMVAGLTAFSYETIKKYCQKGILPASKMGNQWRISKTDFLNWGRCAA